MEIVVLRLNTPAKQKGEAFLFCISDRVEHTGRGRAVLVEELDLEGKAQDQRKGLGTQGC